MTLVILAAMPVLIIVGAAIGTVSAGLGKIAAGTPSASQHAACKSLQHSDSNASADHRGRCDGDCLCWAGQDSCRYAMKCCETYDLPSRGARMRGYPGRLGVPLHDATSQRLVAFPHTTCSYSKTMTA